MKLEIIKTEESDGSWIKVRVDNTTEACISFGKGRTEEEAIARANVLYDFYRQNKGLYQVLKSEII